jgi:hypothetical protein
MSRKTKSQNPKIDIFGREDHDEALRAGLFETLQKMRYGRAAIDALELERRLRQFLEAMKEVVQKVPEHYGEYKLETVSFTAEISAKGAVSLLGSGGELSGKGGITFTLKRTQSATSKDDERS